MYSNTWIEYINFRRVHLSKTCFIYKIYANSCWLDTLYFALLFWYALLPECRLTEDETVEGVSKRTQLCVSAYKRSLTHVNWTTWRPRHLAIYLPPNLLMVVSRLVNISSVNPSAILDTHRHERRTWDQSQTLSYQDVTSGFIGILPSRDASVCRFRNSSRRSYRWSKPPKWASEDPAPIRPANAMNETS